VTIADGLIVGDTGRSNGGMVNGEWLMANG
jgi:hypothetical protein